MGIEKLLLDFLYPLLIFLGNIAVGFVIIYLKRRVGVEKLRIINEEIVAKKSIILESVQYAEQKFKSGKKFDVAFKWAADRAQEKGLDYTPEEIEGLIESTLRELKDTFGENWAKAIEVPKEETKDN